MDSESTPPEPQPEQAPNDLAASSGINVVGIGASAGGIRALQAFFAHMPADSGMAFVIILHLARNLESNAAEVLQHTTSMPVIQVTEPTPVGRNHVYVIPPNKLLSMRDGVIELQDPDGEQVRRAPIDLFFRTLADSHGRNAAVVVLSGSGADGTVGVQRIKENGGVVLAQEPQEAEFDAMPRNVIATGLVDFVLPVADMPAALIEYWRTAEAVQLAPDTPLPAPDDDLLRKIFAVLRARTGHDFSQYKRPTLLRRIGRRMQVNNVTNLAAYLQVLRSHPDEVQALLRDLLISVTNFFRDPEAWLSLTAIIPNLFANKDADNQVRVWVAGCASGEEAYTVAMLLYEHAMTLDGAPSIQIFATDIDEEAINIARQGLYPEAIAADVSPERLQRFFTPEQGRYRIRKEIRDMVLFASHNLVRDPPFSKLDLITCRNLLIYLNRDVQEQVLRLFHFVLRQDGYLMLGASESADVVQDLFTPIDKGSRLFQPRATMPSTLITMPTLPLVRSGASTPSGRHRGAESQVQAFAELDLQVLARYGPPRVIVNEEYEIVHLAQDAGRFLTLADGELSPNVLRMVHPDLRLELRNALFTAQQRKENTETRWIRADIQGTSRLVHMRVQPIHEPEWASGYMLVLFNDMADSGEVVHSTDSDTEPMVQQLVDELQRTKEQLRTTIEQYETAMEEYKAANEELQAINEELRAATEELETSKEELQSVNEELITVNSELKHTVDEVSQSNNDLQNLMASTDIATTFVDRELRLRRYTPSTQAIFNIIPSDVNRPLAHITHRLDYPQMVDDAAGVLKTLVRIEREVPSQDGHWYMVRLLPYRTVEDKIDGVVLTFVDVTERRRAEEAVRKSEERFRALVTASSDTVYTMSADWSVMHSLIGKNFLPDTDNPSQNWIEKYIPQEDQPLVQATVEDSIRNKRVFELEHRVIRVDGIIGWTFSRAIPLLNEQGQIVEWFGAASDITERKWAEEQLRRVAELDAFRVALNDALRPLSDAVAIQATVAGIAMDYFGVDRCYYCEVEDNKAIIWRDASRGDLPSVVGVYPLDDFPLYKAMMNNGVPLVVQDSHTTDLMDAELRQLCIQMKIISFINVPVIKNDQYVGNLCITQSSPREWADFELELAEEIAERTWAAVERARAEEAVRESEARLQLALAAADLGIFSWYMAEDSTEADARALAHFGFPPDAKATLAESLARIFHPEDGLRYVKATERASDPAGPGTLYEEFRIRRSDGERWMAVSATTAFEGTPPVAVRMTGVLADITERKRREANQELQITISEDLSRLSGEEEIIRSVGAKLAAHLSLTCYHYVDVNEERGDVTIRYFWHAMDVPDILGTYPIDGFIPPNGLTILRAGETSIINDVQNDLPGDDAATAALKAGAAAQKIGAYVAIPYSREGRWRAYFAVADSSPRQWTRHEIELIQEVTSLMFPRLERARAEEALRESEERYRTLFDSIDEGFCIFELQFDDRGNAVDWIYQEANPAFEVQTGFVNAVGKRISELQPDLERSWFEQFAEVARTGAPVRFVQYTEAMNKWYDVYAFRVGEAGENRVSLLFTDVSERKRTEEALRESESRLQKAISIETVGVIFFDLEGVIHDRNGAFQRMSGYSREDLQRGEVHWDALTPPEFMEATRKAAEELRTTGLSTPYEKQYIRLDGSRWWGLFAGRRLSESECVEFVIDITESKRAEAALRESEERFRTLANAVPQVIWTNDAQGNANYFNQRWFDYSGLSYEESAGPGWQVIVHPDDAPVSKDLWQHALVAGETFDTDYRLRRADGVYRWHIGRNVPLHDADGQIVGWFGSATDIEDLKQAEADRRESEERFRLLVEGARDYAMFLLDQDNRITFWSAGAERVFGWSEAEALGQSSAIIFTPEDRERGIPEQELRTAVAEGSAADRRWHARKDGARLFADGVLSRLDAEHGNLRGFIKVCRDVTAQRQTEEALQRARDELETRVQERTAELAQAKTRLQELLGALVTAQEEERLRIARELHDEMGQQIAAITLGLKDLESASQGRSATLERLQQLRAMVDALGLEMHRLALELRPTALDDLGLHAAITNYVEQWSAQVGIPVDMHSSGLKDAHISTAIGTALYRIVQEALTNIMKHAQATQVSVLIEKRAQSIQLIIEDNGRGFDVDAMPSMPVVGQRLGLLGMRERIEQISGTLTIESSPDSGTTIYVRVPLHEEEKE